MNETVLRHVTHSHVALHTGLVCVPTGIAVDPRATLPSVPTMRLEEWLHPREREGRRLPARAVATVDLHEKEMLILITDAQLLQPMMVLVGPRALLGEFSAAFAVDPEGDATGPGGFDVRAVFYGRFRAVIGAVVGGGTGGGKPGPRIDPGHLARNLAIAQAASLPLFEIDATRGTPGGDR